MAGTQHNARRPRRAVLCRGGAFVLQYEKELARSPNHNSCAQRTSAVPCEILHFKRRAAQRHSGDILHGYGSGRGSRDPPLPPRPFPAAHRNTAALGGVHHLAVAAVPQEVRVTALRRVSRLHPIHLWGKCVGVASRLYGTAVWLLRKAPRPQKRPPRSPSRCRRRRPGRDVQRCGERSRGASIDT